MADEQDAEETIHQKNSIADHNLDLSLALRPLNSPPFSNDVLHPNNVLHNSNQLLFKSNAQIMSNREQQAIRRREAKVKRDLKRKAASFSAAQNDVVIQAKFSKRRLWGNAGGLYKGHNGNFGDGENRSSVSSGSSSGVSDNYYSNSTAGGNSSDTSSHSSHPHHAPAANVPTPSSALNQPAASPQQEHTPLNSINHNLPQPQLYSSSSNHTHLITNSNQLSKSQTKEAKVDIGKPPKPSGQMTSHQSSRLPQMPCVTTTGNGPKGKTITGFLYKYTKTEVSIVCICHGESFSPAGFVEHAGGVDIENPLKHIRVAPFPLG